MNAVWEVYKLSAAGLRDSVLTKYEGFDGQLNRAKLSQFSIVGTCIGTVPLAMGDRIAMVRNETQLFSGVITGLSIKCADTGNNVKQWEAVVQGDSVVLEWRYVFATGAGTAPAGINVGEGVYDKRPNNNDEDSTQSALNRMLYYVRKHAGPNAHSPRQLLTVSQADDDTRGEQGRSAYHIKKLSDVISEIGEQDELYPVVNTNTSGTRVLTVPEIRDRTEAVVVSPEFGNVAEWGVTRKYPEFNACWVISGVSTKENSDGSKTETRVWVYAEDTASIEKYGRIETVITKGDIKIVPPDPDNEDVTPVTAAEVRKMLTAEAKSQLKEAAATEKWTITMMETDSCEFMTDWKLGDRVKCVIDGKSFTSVIETVDIKYSAGVETVTPTIGDVENGLYGDLYKLLHGIDKRLKTEEEN